MNIIDAGLKFRNSMDIRKSTERLVLHHAAAGNCTVQQVHQWHLNNGWAGIGYHFFVRKDGKVYRGRPENTVGCHAAGGNYNSVGICFEGNFETDTMPSAQKNAGKELVAYLKKKYGISKVQGHRDVQQTACPGRNFPFSEIAGAVGNVSVSSGKEGDRPVQKPGNPVNDYGLYYRAHCQTAGTLAPVRDGQAAGTTGYKKRLEGFWIDLRKLREKYPQAKLSAKVHIQGTGWVRYANVEHDTLLGTTGQGKRIEAVELTLAGVPGKNIYIQLHLAGHGWTGWIPGGFASGSTGIGTAVEAVRFKIA